MEPLLEIDGDVRSFEVFLSSRMPVLAARDVEMFLPCTVNLDPKLREIIAGLYTLGPLVLSDGEHIAKLNLDASLVVVKRTFQVFDYYN